MAEAQTVAIPKRLPLVTLPANRDNTTAKDAKLINAYTEKGPQEGEFYVYKRPGWIVNSNPAGGAAAGNGMYNWQGNIYSVFSSTLYKNGANIGTVDNTGGVYKFSSTLGGTPRLILGNGVKMYYYDNTTLTQMPVTGSTITAGSFVVGNLYTILTVGSTDFTLIGAANNNIGTQFTATGVGAGTGTATLNGGVPSPYVKGQAYLDATTYLMDAKAKISGTNLNDPTIVNPLNTIIAQIEPDGGVALAKQLVYVVACKQWTTEVFYDAANSTGSPLLPVQGAKINYGCKSVDSLQDIDGDLMWISTTRQGGFQVVQLSSLKATVVSTKAIDRLLEGSDYTTVYSWTLRREGHRFYVVTMKNSNLTLAYDIGEGSWSQWTDTNGNYLPIVASSYDSSGNSLLQDEADGNIYSADGAYYTDDNGLIQVDIYTPPFDAGVKARRKHLGKMTFVGDRYPGSLLQVRSNDYDYDATRWTNFRTVDLNAKEPQLNNCGTFYRRSYHFQHRANAPLRISAVELQLDIGLL